MYVYGYVPSALSSLFLFFLGRVSDGHLLRVRFVVGVRVCVVRGHRHRHGVVERGNQVIGHRGQVQRRLREVVVTRGQSLFTIPHTYS